MCGDYLCCWHFGVESGRSEGPFDATGQNFRQRPYASLLRESVQNSMDAHVVKMDDSGIAYVPPVEVSFSFGKIKSSDIPKFKEVRNHIQLCIESYPNNEDYQIFYKSMLDNFDSNYATEFPYLKISDRMTTGMRYVKNNLSNPFQAFVRSSQISVKGDSSGAAGSHGYGKAAYYLLSPLRSLIVSTMTENGDCFFEGASIIGSHIQGENTLSSVGYYDNNGGQPSFYDSETGKFSDGRIPEMFVRKEPGTDFYIMGFQPEDVNDMCEEMICEALRSYWLAIFRRKISISINANGYSVTLNKDTLHELMDKYFPCSADESRQLRALNPRPYYDAYTRQGEDEKMYVSFSQVLPTIGEVSLYIKKCRTRFDKVVYMRKPSMLVYANVKDEDNGFYGLILE